MRATWRTRAATGAVTALLLAGCGGGEPGGGAAAADPTAADPTVADPTAADRSPSDAPVPEGTWSRVVTMQDARTLGVDAALAGELLGPDGEAPVDLEVSADEWKLYVTSDEGERELGDFGTWRTDDSGHWVVTSESPGCRGCEADFIVTSEGDRLTTEIDDGDAPAVDVHLMTEGTWTRQS